MSDPRARKEMAIDALAVQIQRMVEESGNAASFNARAWLISWLERPLPALDGRKPMELLDSESGFDVLSALLARAQAGAFS